MVTPHFSSGSSFSPVPSALVTFCSLAGKPQMRTSAWIGMICSAPPVLSLAFKSEGSESSEPWREAEFAVNLPPEEYLSAAEFLLTLAGMAGDGGLPPGLTLMEASIVRAPLIRECPVRIECVRGRVHARFGQRVLTGDVAVVHMGDAGFRGDRLPTDVRRLKPFARTWRHHLSFPTKRQEIHPA